MRSKKSLRILAAVAAVLLLSIAGLKIFLPLDKIRDLALEEARQRLGREVSVGEVSLSLRGGLGVRLADFAVANPAGFPGDPLANARALDIKLALGPLLKKDIQVTRLVLDQPRLNLLVQADGANNFTFTAPDSPSAGSDSPAGQPKTEPALSIDDFELLDGTFVYSTPEQTTRIKEINSRFVLTSPAPGKFAIGGAATADQMEFSALDQGLALPVDAEYDLLWDGDSRHLVINKVEGSVAGFPVAGQGMVQVDDAGPTTRLTVAANNLDLGRLWQHLQPLVPPGTKGKLGGQGDLDLDLTIPPGGAAAMEYSGKAVFRKTTFTETQMVDELQSMDAELVFSSDEFRITRSALVFNSGEFQLTGSLRDPFPYFLPLEMRTGKPVPTPHLEFQVTSPKLDVDRLMPAASPSHPADAITYRKPSPSSTMVTMEFPGLTASGTFQADSLVYMQVPFTQVSGEIGISDQVMTVSEVTGQVYDGNVNGQVEIDLNQLNDPTYRGSYQAEQIEVDKFVTRFAGLTGVVFGRTTLGGSFNTHGRDPDLIRNSLSLDSDALIKEGRLVTRGQIRGNLGQLAEQTGRTLGGEQALRDLVTHIKVDSGRVGLENLSMMLGNWGDLKFSGFYSFTGELDYQGSLLLTAEQTDGLFSKGVLKELARLLGDQRPRRLELPLTVGGTRSDPKLKLDLSRVTGDLQQKAVENQKGKLKDEAKSKLNDLLKKWK